MHGNVTSSSAAGHAQVFKYNAHDDKWHQVGGDIYGDADGPRFGLSVAMNDDGDIVAIGNINYVRVYEYKKTLTKDAWEWVQVGQDLYGPENNGFFGNVGTIAISGHGRRVLLGGNPRVKVCEYNEDDERWEQVGEDTEWENFGQLGAQVDMSKDGDVVIVGTQGCTNGIDNGYVRIYRFENAKWTQQGQELGGEFSESSSSSVTISRNGRSVVIVKAEDFLRYEPGNARAYEYNDIDQVWEQIGEDIQGGFNASNLSITTVDMNGDGDIIILGGPNNDDDDIDDRNEDTYYGRGNVRVYRYMEGNWIQQGQTIDGLTALDQFGSSVAISQDGERVVIGGPTNSDNGSFSGHVRVYEFLVVNGGNGHGPTPKSKTTKAPKSAKVGKGGKKKTK